MKTNLRGTPNSRDLTGPMSAARVNVLRGTASGPQP